MKVLMYLCTNEYSGAENVACQIIEMVRGEAECIYACPDGNIRGALDERNIKYFPLRDVSLREFRRALLAVKPDIVHAHDMRASFYAACVCGKTPLVLHIHNNAYNARKIGLKPLLFKRAADKSKHIFWVSESSYKGYIFHKGCKGKSSILHNVIDVGEVERKAEAFVPERKYDVIYVGRLTFQKIHSGLLKYWKL